MAYHLDRKCLICSKQLFGRIDKVFCDITCKNHYHSEIRRTTRTIMSETFKIINKNWQIITSLMTEKAYRFKTKKLTLQRLGFDFNTITSYNMQLNKITFGLYNYEFYFGQNDTITITRNKDHSSISPYLFKRLLNEYPLTE